MTAQKYHIKLSEEERKELKKCLYASNKSMESKTHAKILLATDENFHPSIPDFSVIAAKIGVSEVTVWKIRKLYSQKGLTAVLSRKKRVLPPVKIVATGDIEAHIIATCCSCPPAGYQRWTLKLIANKIVLDGLVDSISTETVRRVLKKHNLSLI